MGMAMGRLLGWKQEARIVMVGLGGAGKTTITYKLKLGNVVDTSPTVGFNIETFEYNNITFTAWEIGGQTTYQSLLRHYFHGAHGIIFVVDSSDREWIHYAKERLDMILNEEEGKDAALLVFANKQDLPNAMSAAEIAEKLGLQSLCNRRWHIQCGCATSGEGLYEGLDWLSTSINAKVCLRNLDDRQVSHRSWIGLYVNLAVCWGVIRCCTVTSRGHLVV
ncbi:hypothetical protein ACP70R_023686 [Stipagrostis hirtigluma subsp. patula]